MFHVFLVPFRFIPILLSYLLDFQIKSKYDVRDSAHDGDQKFPKGEKDVWYLSTPLSVVCIAIRDKTSPLTNRIVKAKKGDER